jgi:hypothetical protein
VNVLISLLAFAVTMLALATVVTTVLEMLSRLAGARSGVFRQMLLLVFAKEIEPVLRRGLEARTGVDARHVTAEIERQRRAFVEEVQASPLMPHADASMRGRLGAIARALRADRSDGMTTDEFIRRFARSAAGRALYLEATSRTEQVVQRVADRYDEMADAAREYFKSSSAVLSLLLGVLLAVGYNINGYRVFLFYVDNPEARASVASQAEATLGKHAAAEQRLEEVQQQLPTRGPALPPEQARAEAQKQIDLAKQALAASEQSVANFRSVGLPIGYDRFPHCVLLGIANKDDPRCAVVPEDRASEGAMAAARSRWAQLGESKAAVASWLLLTIITGMLIGLGGPFWYDAVVGLMRVTQMLRGRTDAGQQAAAPAPAPAPTPAEIFDRHVDKAEETASANARQR